MNPIPVAIDIAAHLGVPTMCLVSEVNASFQELTQREIWQSHLASTFPVSPRQGREHYAQPADPPGCLPEKAQTLPADFSEAGYKGDLAITQGGRKWLRDRALAPNKAAPQGRQSIASTPNGAAWFAALKVAPKISELPVQPRGSNSSTSRCHSATTFSGSRPSRPSAKSNRTQRLSCRDATLHAPELETR
jgi:hypothetical protein